MLEVRQLACGYGAVTVVHGLDLDVVPGKITALLGPNGAGKSLTMRALHGLVVPDGGEMTWAGQVADADIQSRQAMVFQKPVLLRRSARANIEFVLRHLSRKADAPLVDAILTRARLAHVAASPARLLSGGEQQRLAIARALALEPDLLFLDEPCANLDPASTLAVEEMIEDARTAVTFDASARARCA